MIRIEERRRISRQRVIKRGRILLGFSDAVIECIVSNESSAGLMIETETSINLPNDIRIQVNNGPIVPVVVRWMLGKKAGLEFVPLHDAGSISCESRRASLMRTRIESIRYEVNQLMYEIFSCKNEIEGTTREMDMVFKKLHNKIFDVSDV